MDHVSTSEIRMKDVINLDDGKRLGCTGDFMLDLCDGRITALIIPRPSGFLWLGNDKDLVIPWCKVECIGADAILVRIDPKEYECDLPRKRRHKC